MSSVAENTRRQRESDVITWSLKLWPDPSVSHLRMETFCCIEISEEKCLLRGRRAPPASIVKHPRCRYGIVTLWVAWEPERAGLRGQGRGDLRANQGGAPPRILICLSRDERARWNEPIASEIGQIARSCAKGLIRKCPEIPRSPR
ncbi:hypothetical protein HN011_006870 [Eciton burchellii]|nr:hypothetical protein HN011_006870 [Eciton burchellii]